MILKYVLAGAPGSGKTKGIEYLQKVLSDKGYTVFSIQETATDLIKSGLDRDDKDFAYYNFSYMLYKEMFYEKISNIRDNNAVILCDRGRMDPKAYRGEEAFKNILAQNNGMTEEQVLCSYDGVLFLQTTADGLTDEYIQDEIRTENVEKAKSLQERLRKVWTPHKNFIYIPNSAEFEDKLKNIEIAIINDIEKRKKSKLSSKQLIEFADTLDISNDELFRKVEIILKKFNIKLVEEPNKNNDIEH